MRRLHRLVFTSSAAAVLFAFACGGGDDAIEVAAPDAGPDGPTTTGEDATVPPPEPEPEVDAGPEAGTGLDGGVCNGGPVTITRVDPKFGGLGVITPVGISGAGFELTPSVYLRSGGDLSPLEHVAFVSSSGLAADVPTTVPVGTYDVVVVNPNGCAGILSDGFKIVATPPPQVLEVSPATGTTQTDVDVVVKGCNFPTGGGAKLSTVDASEKVVDHTVTTVTCDGAATCGDGSNVCTMTGTIKTKTATLAAGAYLVRVTNVADATYGEYSAFVVTSPDGKLSGSWAAGPKLNVGRRSLASTAARIDDARRFLYAIGGENASGAALDSIEVAPLDKFGRVGTWTVQRNTLNTKRAGLALTRVGRYLYVFGGTSTTNGTKGTAPTGAPLSSIERAVILDPAGAPKLDKAVVSTDAGTLAAGTYYYKVAALTVDPDNAGGETLPSDEVVATLTANGQVSLSWAAVPNATEYLVYRSPTTASPSQSQVLLKNVGNVLAYVDTGADAPGTQKPLVMGATGLWTTLGTTLAVPRVNASAATTLDPNGNRYVYAVGGYGQCPGDAAAGRLTCYEKAAMASDGSAVTGSFAVGDKRLARARMRFGLDAITADNGPPSFDPGAGGGVNTAAFLFVGGGQGIQSTGNTIEYALVNAGGDLGDWASTTGFANQRDGSQVIVSNGYAYAFFGGAAPSYSSTSDLSTRIVASPTSLTLGNWSNAGGTVSQGAGRHGMAEESAYFYRIGGTTNDNDALDTVFQIVH
jgi:hypothetical protein